MSRPAISIFVWLCLGCFILPATTQETRHKAKPNGEDARHFAGHLVIAGGGALPPSVTGEFVRLAGGKQSRIVVIPTASERADQPDNGRTEQLWKARGAANVALLHTRSREKADQDAFLAPLRNATGVWFNGGQQSRIADAYVGTKFEQELRAVLQRNGVVGGSSAGAAIMSKVMITGGNPMAKTATGFGLLADCVVDQHFLRRNRTNRLLGVIHGKPQLVGIGIDEGTAIICNGDKIRVAGSSFVMLFATRSNGAPLNIESLKSGDERNIAEFRTPAQ